jgi:hypothetical protein
MLMQMIPSAEAIGQIDRETSKARGARTFVTCVAFVHAAILCKASGSGSEGWKTRLGKFLAKMYDVLARAACNFEDDTRRRQDIAKDIKNEITITDCRRRLLAVIDHLPRTFALA